jgi:PIN domain nuclease of toxin-antitoxin system
MIILDTHIWVWWVHGDEQLTSTQAEIIKAGELDLIGVNAISVWEIAKLVEYNRLELPCPLHEWVREALSYPRIQLIMSNPEKDQISLLVHEQSGRQKRQGLRIIVNRMTALLLFLRSERIRS